MKTTVLLKLRQREARYRRRTFNVTYANPSAANCPSQVSAMLHRTFVMLIVLIGAASFSHAQYASTHNETCSHAEGTCGKAQHVTTGLPPMFESDQALLGNIAKEFDSFAMRPAAFPSFLPGDSIGMGSTTMNLPQPALMASQGSLLTMGGTGGSASDQIGLF